jgi:hypothetical protein
VKTLLSLKADYKTATGQEWKPGLSINLVMPSKNSICKSPRQISLFIRQLKGIYNHHFIIKS